MAPLNDFTRRWIRGQFPVAWVIMTAWAQGMVSMRYRQSGSFSEKNRKYAELLLAEARAQNAGSVMDNFRLASDGHPQLSWLVDLWRWGLQISPEDDIRRKWLFHTDPYTVYRHEQNRLAHPEQYLGSSIWSLILYWRAVLMWEEKCFPKILGLDDLATVDMTPGQRLSYLRGRYVSRRELDMHIHRSRLEARAKLAGKERKPIGIHRATLYCKERLCSFEAFDSPTTRKRKLESTDFLYR